MLSLSLISHAWSPLPLPGSHRPCCHVAYVQSGPAPQRSDPHPIVHLHLQTHRSVLAALADRREPRTTRHRRAAVAMSAVAEAWHTIWLSPPTQDTACPGELVARGDAVLCLPNVATSDECAQLTAEASASAARLRQVRYQTGLDPEGRTRLPTRDAAARAAAVGTPCARPLSHAPAYQASLGLHTRLVSVMEAALHALTGVACVWRLRW